MVKQPDSSAATTIKAPDHLAFLDGIRGGAALWVLLSHCMIWGNWFGLPLPPAKVAVDVFMVISGYLMHYQAVKRSHSEPPGTWMATMAFLVRRFFRIAPLYYLVLIVTFVFGREFCAGYTALREANAATWAGDQMYDPSRVADYSPASFLLHVTFLFGLFPKYTFSTFLPDWSISLEMQFYAVFPFVFLFFRRRGFLIGAAAIWIAAVAVRKFLPHLGGGIAFPEPSFLPLKMPLFLVGILVASASLDFRKAPGDAALRVVLAMALAARESISIVLLTGLLFWASLGQAGTTESWIDRCRMLVTKLLGNRLTAFLADTSYAVYLIHGFFISFVGGWLFTRPEFLALSPAYRFLGLMLIVAIGSYSAGWLLHRTIERPGIELGRRIVRRWSRLPVPARVQPAGGPNS